MADNFDLQKARELAEAWNGEYLCIIRSKLKICNFNKPCVQKNQDGGFGSHAIRKSMWLCYWNKQILSLRIALPKYHKVIHQKCKIWSIINLKSVFFQLMLSENCSLSQKFWKLKNLLQQLYKQKFTLSLVI